VILLEETIAMSPASQSVSNSAAPGRSIAWKDRVLPALLAAALGGMLLYAAGFAETELLHNAAHDARHSAATPCH
jgi:cobalt transporter subunit CbtB